MDSLGGEPFSFSFASSFLLSFSAGFGSEFFKDGSLLLSFGDGDPLEGDDVGFVGLSFSGSLAFGCSCGDFSYSVTGLFYESAFLFKLSSSNLSLEGETSLGLISNGWL